VEKGLEGEDFNPEEIEDIQQEYHLNKQENKKSYLFDEIFPKPAEEAKREKRLTHDEREIIKGLIKKYGTNYKKMERDIELNPYQDGAKTIERKIKIFYEKKYDQESPDIRFNNKPRTQKF